MSPDMDCMGLAPAYDLELQVATVTGHAVAAVLAATEVHSLGFLSLEFLRRKTAVFVAAVTEWLSAAFPTSAVPVGFSRFYFYCKGGFLSDDWLLI